MAEITYYQITYFDQKENCRVKYLNGTSWETENGAIEEFERIRKRDYELKSQGTFPGKYKYALEAIRGKKRRLVKML
jgi:hypothetical protein